MVVVGGGGPGAQGGWDPSAQQWAYPPPPPQDPEEQPWVQRANDAADLAAEASEGFSCSDWLPDVSNCLPDCGGCDCSFGLFFLSWMALTAPTQRARPARAARASRAGAGVGARVGIAAIRGYKRWLSPRLPTRCRHTPTCSTYGLEAVSRYGLVTGSRLTAGRIGRCNPTTPRGTADPVP